MAEVRIHRRRDPILERRWFAILYGTNTSKKGVRNVTRFFFPWFYVDFLTPKKSKVKRVAP